MPAVRIRGVTAATAPVLPSHPKVTLEAPEIRGRVRFAAAPVLTYWGIAQQSSTYPRVGRKPVLSMLGQDIRVISFTAVILGRDGDGRLDPQKSVESNLHNIRDMARRGVRVAFTNFGPSTIGWWRITDLSVTDLRRQHGTNHITQATVSFTLTEAVEAVVFVGPLTGGVSPPASPPAAAAPGVPAPPGAPSTHTVKGGETLSSIALQHYKDASKFRLIADANGITNPNLIRVGQVLTIPAA